VTHILYHVAHIMRKQFETRVRLVIYMDQLDLNRLTARAKREGRVLVAWARETLMREMEEPTSPVEFKPASRLRKHVSLTGAVQSHSVQGEPATPLASVNKKDSIPETVKHTANSNRLTCGCATCVAYRHDHGIPLGGMPKRAKK
jgi:hypothetical protein